MKTTSKFKTILFVILILMAGIFIGCHKDDFSLVGQVNAETTEYQMDYMTTSMSPSPVPAPSVSYQRMNVYGKYYLVFTTSQGGLFVIKE